MHLATAIALWVIAAFLGCGTVLLGVGFRAAEQRRTRVALAIVTAVAVLIVAAQIAAGLELTR